MRVSLLSVLASIAFTVLPLTCVADDEGPLYNNHSSSNGIFSHWSDVRNSSNANTELEYAICNHNPAESLVYQWPEARISSGSIGAIPPFTCHTLIRSVASFTVSDGRILFTQSASRHPARTYVQIPEFAQRWPNFFRSQSRIFYSIEGFDAPSSASLDTLEVDQGDSVFFSISTDLDQSVTIVFGTGHLSEEAIERLVQDARERGLVAESTSLGSVLSPESAEIVSEDRLQSPVITLSNPEGVPGAFETNIGESVVGVAENFVSMINEQGDLYFDAAITSMRTRARQ